MTTIAPYQKDGIEKLMKYLPGGAKDVLEIGSDLDCCVMDNLTGIFSGTVTGLNPDQNFPRKGAVSFDSPFHALRSDGCDLPFKDNSFDAILSVATLEHVQDLGKLMKECSRVLRPGGVFYTKFSPIWACGIGHHVFAIVGHKEARFWKPGKNPLPDYSHLLWGPDEMRDFLHSGPCDERLIEPIISWVYYESGINRCFLEDYLKAFKESPLKNIACNLIPYSIPPEDVLAKLNEKYGPDHNFSCQGIEAVFVEEVAPEKFNEEGEKLYEVGDICGAEEAFLNAIRMDSTFTAAYNNLGVLYWQSGDIEKAEEYFASALDNDYDDRSTVLNCGKILTALKREDEARKLYSHFLQRNSDDNEIAQLLADLQGKNGNGREQGLPVETGVKDSIEILSIDLIDGNKNLVEMIYNFSNKLGIGLGWHYILDITWIILNVTDLPKGSIILDAGAGNGLLQCILAGLGYKVISADFMPRTIPQAMKSNWNVIEVNNGIDYDNEYIRQLKDNYYESSGQDRFSADNSGIDKNEFEKQLNSTDSVIVYYRTDITHMQLIKSNSVDCIVSLSALEHNNPDSIADAYNEFKRVLKPDKKMIITMSSTDREDWFHEQSKGWCFSEKSLAGFFDLYCYRSNYHLYNELFSKLKEGKVLRENLATAYFKSGKNGMPWGKWDPKYQPVGILKYNTDSLSRINVIKNCDSLYDEFRDKRRFLEHIFLDVNNNCNLNCVMCSRDNRREEARNMTPDEFRVIAGKSFGYVTNLQISCAWEASISKHIPDILSLLPAYNVPNTIFLTNGNYMTDDLMRAIIDSGLNRLLFSLEETDPELYSKIRVNGDLKKVIKHIAMVNALKRQRGAEQLQLGVNMTMMKSNIERMPEFVKFAAINGIEFISGRHLILLENCDTGEETLYADMERSNDIIRESKIVAQKNNIISNIPFLTMDIEKKSLCTRPWDSLYISSNGDVSCCPRISRIRSFGNLLTESFEEVFYKNATVSSLRKNHIDGNFDNEICEWCAGGHEQRETINQQF